MKLSVALLFSFLALSHAAENQLSRSCVPAEHQVAQVASNINEVLQAANVDVHLLKSVVDPLDLEKSALQQVAVENVEAALQQSVVLLEGLVNQTELAQSQIIVAIQPAQDDRWALERLLESLNSLQSVITKSMYRLLGLADQAVTMVETMYSNWVSMNVTIVSLGLRAHVILACARPDLESMIITAMGDAEVRKIVLATFSPTQLQQLQAINAAMMVPLHPLPPVLPVQSVQQPLQIANNPVGYQQPLQIADGAASDPGNSDNDGVNPGQQ